MAAEHVPPFPVSSAAAARCVRPVRSAPLRSAPAHGAADPVFELVGQPTPGGVTWAWARRDLDLATVAAARHELSAIVESVRSPGNVLVYLGHECFVDLRGLRLLLVTAARVRARGGALAVVAPPHCLRRMIRLSGLDAELPLVPTARRATRWARSAGVSAR